MRKRKLLSILLSLAMLVSLLSVEAFAAGSEDTNSGGVVVDKTATLEDDGTYTIELSAYATGTSTTVTEKSGVPLDIVLVIDQSGSMAYNDSGKSTNTASDRRMYKLQEAVKGFVDSISANGNEYGVDHRIAIAGYAAGQNTGKTNSITGCAYNGSGSYWVNTGLYVNGSFKNYADNSSTSSLTGQDYKNALVSVNDENGKITSSITDAIALFKASGGTYTEYGLTMAQKVFDNNPIEAGSNRKRIVVLFTDGETNSAISTVLSSSNTLKGSTYNATVYCVGFGSSVKTDFLSHVSSNYTTASYSSSWGGSYSGTQVANKYSMTASNREELNEIFENISQDIQNPTTSVTLNGSAVMKDIIGEGFKVPDNYDVSQNITIKTVAGSTDDNKNYTWGTETTSPSGITANVEGNEIAVTGFSYADKYIATGHAGEKLVVQIKGIEATDSAVTNNEISTNDAASGIYSSGNDDAAIAAAFPQPKTILTSKTYVLDYAKAVDLDSIDWAQNTLTKIGSDMAKGTVDVSANYGKVTKKNDGTVTYQPTTTNWKGYDSFYALGKTNDETITAVSANTNGNLWTKISVLPANNVYYEDDFVTDNSTGTVGIVYTGTWTTDGTASVNTETANGDVHGWESSLADDTTYSDGSAHKLTTGATATFTFTGTGVDIYSRTDMSTGTVTANLYTGETASKAKIKKALIVDNKSVSGNKYYQIPTLSFADLEYGTYTVKITVTNQAENRTTYYLDGIRVYNPIEEDALVSEAYGGKEVNAVFTKVRDLLNDKLIAFIDEGNDGDGNPTGESTVGDYNDSEIGKLAPENEIYLSQNQQIVLNVTGDNTYYIGLKAPQGATTAEVTNGSGKSTYDVNHSTDLYYEVVPGNNDEIVITNTGDNLLSITKLRTTGSGESGISTLSNDEALSAVATFRAASYVSDQSVPSSDEELIEQENSNVIESAEAEESIVNEPGEVSIENSDVPENTSVSSNEGIIKKLFNSVLKNLVRY